MEFQNLSNQNTDIDKLSSNSSPNFRKGEKYISDN